MTSERDRAIRPRALIVTVYGLYAREVGGWLSVQSLIKLMSALGVDEPAVRSSISRLKRRGLLLAEKVDGAAGYALSDRARARIPTPQLNRFLADAVAARQPPAGSGRRGGVQRLKLLFITQTAVRPPRFSIQVNSRARITRDYAYYLENRLRERYGLDGVPLIIDFVQRSERREAAHAAVRRG